MGIKHETFNLRNPYLHDLFPSQALLDQFGGFQGKELDVNLKQVKFYLNVVKFK